MTMHVEATISTNFTRDSVVNIAELNGVCGEGIELQHSLVSIAIVVPNPVYL
jgi:hypothetical protein